MLQDPIDSYNIVVICFNIQMYEFSNKTYMNTLPKNDVRCKIDMLVFECRVRTSCYAIIILCTQK